MSNGKRIFVAMWLLITLLTILMVGCADDSGGKTGNCYRAPPTVSATDPANNAVGVSMGGNITATFSEAMDPLTITTTTMTLQQVTSQLSGKVKVQEVAVFVTGTVTYSGVTAVFNPTINLNPNTIYTATITTGAKNLTGNSLASDFVWTFTTGLSIDVTPPTVNSTVPANNAANVSLSGNLAATFSETMDPSTITAVSMTLLRGTTIVAGTVAYSGVTAIFNPTANLSSSAVYTATITTSVKDLAGNSMENNYVWTFTTGTAPDVTRPTVSSTVPANITFGVSLGSNIAATFSEAMDPLTITTSTVTLRHGTTTVSGTVSYSGVTAIFNPALDLSPSTLYTATITNGVKDLADNTMASNYDWTFTTGTAPDLTPPSVNSTIPSNNATGVSLSGNLAATFSEAMNPLTITTTSMTLRRGSVTVAGTVSYSGVTAVFNPSVALVPSTLYTATITTSARDLADNAITSNYVWTFTTGVAPDVTAPTVSSTYPANNTSGIPLGGNLVATFSESMNPLTITTATVTLRQGSTAITGTVTYNGVTANFNPTGNLAPSTLYTATITTGVNDLAGNAMISNYVWTFTTGTAPDLTPPTVNSTVPVNNATGVSLGGFLVATFSEAMDPSSISTSTIVLRNGTILVNGTITYSGVTASFNPAADLAPSTVYTATITTGVRDLVGNPMASNYVWTFTTGTSPDLTPPSVNSTVPSSNATGVALGGNLTATFSEAMDPLTLTTATMTLRRGTTTVAGTVSYSGVTAVFNPAVDFVPSTLYTATISTAVRDLAGNAMTSNYSWSFTTGVAADVTPPTVSSTIPVSNATGVSLGGNLSATFSEALDPLSITAATVMLRQGTTTIVGTVSYNGVTVSFNPSANLTPSTLYTATITTGVRDLTGNAMASNYVWSFTTGIIPDITPPSVNSTVPTSNATGVSFSGNLSATFSEAMDPLTVTTATMTLRRGTTTVAGSVSYTGVTAVFNPAVDLIASTVYTATITTGVRDLAGNAMTSNYVWTFTTGTAPDITPPTVSSTFPANNTSGISLSGNLAATFSEALDPLTITSSTMTLRQGTTLIPGSVTYNGVTAGFNPTADLAPSTLYTATLTTGVEDLAGNAMVTNYVWTFTTGVGSDLTPPTVNSTIPANNAVGVSLSGNVVATFSETMDPSTITTSTMTLRHGTTTTAGTVTFNGVTASFNPSANLLPSTVYTATITNDVRDLANNAMVNDFVWTFTTGVAPDITPPVVNSTVPLNNATGVSLGGNLAATFSEAMDPLTITTATMTLRQGTTSVPGTVSYNGVTASFNPTASLAASTLYTATVTNGVSDLAGNAMVSNYVWTFTTGTAPDVTPPTVVSTVPISNATGVSLSGNLAVTFSEALDPTTINTTTMTLRHGTTSVTGTVTYNGVTAGFNPTVNLLASTLYTATITTGVRDMAGNPMVSSYVWTFTTGTAPDITPPTVISSVPVNAATGVTLGGNLSATFSEAMNPLTITATTVTLRRGTTPVVVSITYTGVVATINPATDLLPSTLYTATITTSAQDLAGNGLVSNFVWTFTTGDFAPPTVVSTVPLNNATGVTLGGNLTATFSEAMDPATITTTTMTLRRGTTTVPGAVTYTGLVATFNPTANLLSSTVYTATITTGARDLAGNAIANNFVWTFTTGDFIAPTVTSTVPLNNATGVSLSGNLTATFSERMDPASISTTTMTLRQGVTPVVGLVTYNGLTATFNPTSNLLSSTLYTATITTGARDSAGNALASNHVWTFTTGDFTPPIIVSTVPMNNATGASLGGNITATFSEVMDTVTITNLSMTLRQGVTPIIGVVSYSGLVATFNPTNSLVANTTYTATVTTAVRDTAGNAMENDSVWTFTTGAFIDLRSAGAFAILSGSTVTNTGPTILNGDLGVSPGTAVTGFPPGVVNGTIHAGDPVAAQAILDLTLAYNEAVGRSTAPISVAGNIGGQTLAPGLYHSTSSLAISSGDLTLDAQGDANAVWIFQMASTLTVTTGRHVVLSGGARPNNIYWQVGTSATLGTTTIFKGNILADQSITLMTGATLDGRALTRIAAVTLDANVVTVPAP
ncbi:MAG: Ig-like domain-containing protein [bacterium]|nr:Ig-like domain-containing protein [bacterium]